jgi:hypothetical protein
MFTPNRIEDLSPEAIRARIVDALQRELPGHALEVRQDEPYRLRLCHPEAGELVLNIGNLVQEVRHAAPGTATRIIGAFVTLAKQALNPPTIRLDRVYPALRHHAFLREGGITKADPLIGEGPGDLVSVVLADVGDGLATVTAEVAKRAGFQAEAVLEAAERNFVGVLPDDVFTSEQGDGVISVGLDEFPWLGTSLLFVPSILTGVMAHYGLERVLVGVPSRETVDMIDATRPDAAARMERWMASRLAGPRPQSEFVFSFAGGDAYLKTTHRMSSGRLYGLH